MMKKLAFVLALLFVIGARAETTLEAVVRIYDHRACTGCHQGKTARTSMAYFTTMGGERELLKSFA